MMRCTPYLLILLKENARSDERRILGRQMSPLSLTMFSTANICMILPKDQLSRFPLFPLLLRGKLNLSTSYWDHFILFSNKLSFVILHVQLPSNIKLQYSTGKSNDDSASRKKKGKCKEGENDTEPEKVVSNEHRLTTLDIFAGCGGLSEGLEQSGMLIAYLLLYVEAYNYL